jgi:ketosteroid isomerase-like protein
MGSTNLEVVRRLLTAYNEGDIAGVLAELDEDVEWQVPAVLPLGGVYRGHDELRRFFATVFSRFRQPRIEPGELLNAGNHVVYLGRFTAQPMTAGPELDVEVAFVWTMRDGKVTRMREYSDTATILRFAGRP